MDDTLAIEIPFAFGRGTRATIVFSADNVTFDRRTIYYKDASATSYQAVNQSVNLVPTSQSYSYMVASSSETIKVSFGTSFYIGNKKVKDAWARLVGVSRYLIEPHIVEKFVRRIFGNGEIVEIGGVELTSSGYSRRKLFGGRYVVSWHDKIFIPEFASGSVTLWENKNGKATPFHTVSMAKRNAVVLPELVRACQAVALNNSRQ